AVLLAASASMAQAPKNVRGGQDRPGDRNDPGRPRTAPDVPKIQRVTTPILLIKSDAVQKELKLTEEQKKEIKDINEAFDRMRTESVQGMLKERQGKEGAGLDQEALMAMMANVRQENEAALERILQKRQRQRLFQIVLQMEGPLAVRKPE